MVEKKEACKASQSSWGRALPPRGHLQDMCTWRGPQAEEAPGRQKGGHREAQDLEEGGRQARQGQGLGGRPHGVPLPRWLAASEAWPAAGNLLLASVLCAPKSVGSMPQRPAPHLEGSTALLLAGHMALAILPQAAHSTSGPEQSHALCLQHTPPTAIGPPPGLWLPGYLLQRPA